MKFTFTSKLYFTLAAIAVLTLLWITSYVFSLGNTALVMAILQMMSIVYLFVLLIVEINTQNKISKEIGIKLETNIESSGFAGTVKLFIDRQEKELKTAASMIELVAEGNIAAAEQHLEDVPQLKTPLTLLTHKLSETNRRERLHAWTVEGEAKFAKILRENPDHSITETAEIFLSHLVKYTGSNQGSIYLVKEDLSLTHDDGKYIELIAAFAFDRKKHIEKRIGWRDGLVGQCIYENDVIYITEVPEDYVKITSGLGSANPRCIVIVPVYHNDKEIGAIELISFKVFNEAEVSFLRKIAENLGSSFHNIIESQSTLKLLQQAEAASAHLREQEAQLMQNDEELRAAQESLNNKLIELQAESNLTQCIVTAINKSNASVEFDMYGNVLTANQMFLSVMGYELEQIQGKHESFMLAEDDLNSEKYLMTWESLKQGNFISGEFIRKSTAGQEIWLEATYNPIVDLEGKPYKIIMFASFTNELKEKENEIKNKQALYNEAGGFLELDTDLNVKTANAYFLNLSKYKRKDVKNLSWTRLIHNDKQHHSENKFAIPSEENGIFKGLIYINDAEGNPICFDATMMSKKDTKGKVTGYNVFLHHAE